MTEFAGGLSDRDFGSAGAEFEDETANPGFFLAQNYLYCKSSVVKTMHVISKLVPMLRFA
jgi:hypothetical protein